MKYTRYCLDTEMKNITIRTSTVKTASLQHKGKTGKGTEIMTVSKYSPMFAEGNDVTTHSFTSGISQRFYSVHFIDRKLVSVNGYKTMVTDARNTRACAVSRFCHQRDLKV